MTTLAALATKDALIMGCDSLGSVTKKFIDPMDVYPHFALEKGGGGLVQRLGPDGKPTLTFPKLTGMFRDIPYNHMTYVDKLFSLAPLPMGVMITGIASIGDLTIKNLVNQFKESDQGIKARGGTNYTVRSVAKRLLTFIGKAYEQQYEEDVAKPALEMIIGGYDRQKHIPTILRIHVHENEIKDTISSFGIVFGGQMTEIQRIVFGTDTLNRIGMIRRSSELLNAYSDEVVAYLKSKKINADIPRPDVEKKYQLFSDAPGGWDLLGFEAGWGDFSEKNAIECVKFFIDVMVKTQQFGDTMPTVGGEICLAIITKTEGFKFCSHATEVA